MINNFLNTLGLASRAGKIVTGETLIAKIRSNDVNLVIIASDASLNIKKKLTDKCNFYKIPFVEISNIDNISKSIGKNNRVAIGITDSGFAKILNEKIGG